MKEAIIAGRTKTQNPHRRLNKTRFHFDIMRGMSQKN